MTQGFRSLTLIVLIGLMLAAAMPAAPALAQDACAGAPAPRLSAGAMGRVVVSGGVGNNLRATASGTGTVLGVMPDGEIFRVVAGPQCVEGYNWWQIRRWDGQTGYTAESAASAYWVEPWPQAGAAIPAVTPPAAETGRIAFVRVSDEASSQLIVMGADGAEPALVSGEVDGVSEAAWSPDGTRLIFVGGSDAGPTGLYLVDADGQNLVQVPASFAAASGPQWSPDGTRIIFAAAPETADPDASQLDLYTIDADGTGLAALTVTPSADEFDPAWSPDGTQIAFTSETAEDSDVLVMDVATDETRPLAEGDAAASKPVWSPDGTRIAYYTATETGAMLVIANADGTDPTELAPIFDQRSPSHAPAFSPDGTRIAYTTAATLDASATSEVFSVRTDGTDTLQYTADGAMALAVRWSMDGQWLIFTSSRSGNFDLWAVRANGAGIAQLTNTADDDFTPRWWSDRTAPPGTATPPGVGDALGGPELLLIYDAGVPVFTLKNASENPVNLMPLSFSGAGVTLPATVWNTEFLASPLNAFKPGGCLQMWQFGLPVQDAPPECGDSRQGWISEETGFFWTQGTFDVLYDGAPIATCDAARGQCDVNLPGVEAVG